MPSAITSNKNMHRFHLPAENWESSTLPTQESHHCANVLRLEAGELGASEIAPILSDRTVVQLDADELEKKRGKWQEVALEACKQCGQNHLPAIAKPSPPKEFFERSERGELMLIASLQPDARPLKSILAEFVSTHSRLPRTVTVMVGPEGDFTPAELSLAKSSGCIPVTLGPIILRTETAAIYCLSVLAHELFQPAKP